PDPARAQPKEGLKGEEVSHREDRSHVPFEVGGDVAGIPVASPQTTVIYGWIAAAPKQCEKFVGRLWEAADLRQGERQELKKSRAPRQRLPESMEESKVCRSGEDEASAGWSLVHHGL